jgi:hypothetical protein
VVVEGFGRGFPAEGFLGLLLRAAATASRSLVLCLERSMPFGKYCRRRPLVFSLVTRCQGLCASQK